MKVVKQTAEYTIYQKRNERYAVKGSNKKFVNGEDKVKILLSEELIKLSEPAEQPAEEPAEEETSESSEEEASEE